MYSLVFLKARRVDWGRRMRIRSIRARLLLAFVLMSVLSTVAISIGSIVVGYFSGRQQVHDRLDSVAALKVLSVKAWADTLQMGLLTVSSDQYASQRISVVLGLAKLGKNYVWYDDALRVRLSTFVEASRQFEEICLVDVRGTAVLCTGSVHMTDDCYGHTFFQKGLVLPYTEVVFSSPTDGVQLPDISTAPSGHTSQTTDCGIVTPVSHAPFAVVARPVTSDSGENLGVIVGRAPSQGLVNILADRTGLGSTGKAYLVNSSFAVLPVDPALATPNREATNLWPSLGLYGALTNPALNSEIHEDYQEERVLGTYRWLPNLQVVLAVEQSTSEAFAGIIQGLVVNLSIALFAALVAVGVSFRVTRSITHPLVTLVETASQIAAGNLQRAAPVQRDDEIGILATTFNSMTAQLRDLISHLEERVEDRTRALHEANEALRHRALQMETNAKVSRQITSILEIDDLLTRVVHLIRDAFGYTHARIFLLDGDELIQRANTNESVTETVRVRVDMTSFNTEAARTQQAVVVNDVTQDDRFLMEELLPETRSELAIPLRIGDRLIGTLDVLSDRLNAFTLEDLVVIQSLGDQIAVAIENAHLYTRSRDLAILMERNRLARDLHDSVIQSLYSLSLLFEGWRRLLGSGEITNVEEHFGRAAAIAHQALREMRLMVYELRPAALEQDGLLGALQQRLDAVERRAGVKVRLVAEDLIDLPLQLQECLQLNPKRHELSLCSIAAAQGCRSRGLGYALYRISLEALNNALKHSRATEVAVRFSTQGDQIILQVTDDGCGFEPSSPEIRGGMGLNNMRQRAQEVGGELNISSPPGKGTAVTAQITCKAFTTIEVTPL